MVQAKTRCLANQFAFRNLVLILFFPPPVVHCRQDYLYTDLRLKILTRSAGNWYRGHGKRWREPQRVSVLYNYCARSGRIGR